MNAWELSILYWIRDNVTNPIGDAVLPVISSLANHGELWIAIALVLLCIPKTRKTGLTMAIAMIVGFLLGNLLLKNVVARIRPYDLATDVTLLVERLSDYAFPSGHTLVSFEAATVLTVFHRRWGYAALSLATVIALSRLYLFVHYPTDVLAGMVMGVGIGLGACWLVKKYSNKNVCPT